MVMNKHVYLVSFDSYDKARSFCMLKNMLQKRIYAVCKSLTTGKYWVCDLCTAIALQGWYEVVV